MKPLGDKQCRAVEREIGKVFPGDQGAREMTALTWLKIHSLRSWMEHTANEPVEPIIGMSFEKGKALASERHAAKLARLKAQIDGMIEATP